MQTRRAAGCCTIGVLLGLIWGPATLASEGGTTHYLPGSAATLIDLPPSKPGWVVEPIYLHYSGDASASRPISIGGTLAAGLDATSDAVLAGGFYTFDEPVLGAHFSMGVYVPYVWITANATVTTPFGALRREDDASGIGDATLIPAIFAWKTGDWQYSAFIPISAPTGDYDTGQLANPGLNYWTFDPTLGVAYSGSKNGFNATLFVGYSMNSENDATDYRSGSQLHIDASIQQLLPVGPGYLGVGVEGFYVEQMTDDDGSGATLGSFKGRTAGFGPVVSYVVPSKKANLVAEFRWLPETDVENRLEGDYVWVKIAYQF